MLAFLLFTFAFFPFQVAVGHLLLRLGRGGRGGGAPPISGGPEGYINRLNRETSKIEKIFPARISNTWGIGVPVDKPGRRDGVEVLFLGN
ncbi:MAG: hypothetical protein ACI82A_001262 [Candidatus Azotimanducaceae bacterium]|jgi:hypothetical protein